MFIPGLPQIPYRNGIGNYEGVVCHATDNYNDSALNERNYEANGNWKNAFVHYFVDDTTIIQVADENYQSWGCGHAGNERFVNIELCQTYDANKFNEAYSRYIWLIAKLLHEKGLGVIDGKTLVSHDWVTKNLGGTTHSDPIAYLNSFGITWEEHINKVSGAYKSMDAVAKFFYTGGYAGDSLSKIHMFLYSNKFWFQPAKKDDGTIMFLVGGFYEGTKAYDDMKKYLDDNKCWYEIR